MSPDFINTLEAIRVQLGFPLYIVSGFRCIPHNARIGGVVDSAHLTGLAVDIACTDSWKRSRILDVAYTNGVLRRGISKSFIHLDIGGEATGHPSPRTWLYT